MNNTKINNEINLTYPDSFKEMGEAELIRYFSSAQNRWGVYDADRHIILSVGWTKGGFRDALTDAESVLIGIETRLRRSLVNYQRVASYQYKVASKKARAIRFEYRVNDAALVQVADFVVFKYNKKFYVIQYITRLTNAAEVRPEFEEVLKSVTLG